MSVTGADRVPRPPGDPTAGLSNERQALLDRWLARAQAARRPAGPQPITARPPGSRPPLSSAQARMWFLEQYAPGTSTYTMWMPMRLGGMLDAAALRAALRTVVARHESLRMRFPAGPDGVPLVDITTPSAVPFQTLDVSDRAGEEDPADRARALLGQEVAQPFDLAAGPLVRAVLVRLGPDDHVFCLLVHHIVIDGWSTDIVLNEMWLAYEAIRAGRAPDLPELPVGYGDYAAWQQDWLTGDEATADLRYWRERLIDVPPLTLPTDRPYPPTQTSTGATAAFRFEADLTAGLRRVARQHQATEYMALMAGFQAVLGWYAGQSDFGVGSQVAGRDRGGTDGMVGLLVNTVVFRADLRGDPTFGTLLGRVRDAGVAAYAHQHLPFEHLVSELNVPRDVRRPPVFQVNLAMLNWDHAGRSRHGGLRFERFPVENPVTRHELACYVRPDGTGLAGHLTYNTDLFDRETVLGIADRFRCLLAAAVADPDRRLSDVDLLGPAERARLAAWSDGGAPGSRLLDPSTPAAPHALAEPVTPARAATLAEVIRPWVMRTPAAPAVVYGARQLSYAELSTAAERLAAHLRRRGARPDVRVGICLNHAPSLAVAVLAAVTAGAAYLPLDPEVPAVRLAFLLSDSDSPILVTEEALRDRFAEFPGEVVLLDADGAAVDGAAVDDATAGVTLDGVTAADDLAYVIYTSGSTGRPKGVAVAHSQAVRYVDGVRDRLRIAPGSRFGLMQSMSFDFSVTMFWLALATGGCVHLLPRRVSGRDLAAYLARTRVDYLKLTPSHLTALAGDVADVAELMPRRALVLGGEASRLDWARDLARRGGIAVVNHYGPTETTVGVTTFEIPAGGDVSAMVAEGGSTPIGRPLPHTRVYVLDQRFRPVPSGAVGEICVGGDRLARGYLRQPALTAQRFLPDPFGSPGGRLYRTGDLGRWLPTGDLEFLGRRDDQVKIRGYRVEPGEVAGALAALPGVGQAVVVVRDERLVAYLERAGDPTMPEANTSGSGPTASGPTASGATDLDIGEIRRCLAVTLPEYLLPAQAVWLDRLPLLPHGKVDRRALPEPVVERPEHADGSGSPDGPVQCAIAEVWAQVLRLSRVGADDDFFDLGGHSLLATQVVSRLRRALPAGTRPITVMDLFKHPTVRRLAEHAERAAPTSGELLYELTPSVDPALHTLSLVCVPYGGATAIVYQPLADALPSGQSLFAVAPPGRDLATTEADRSIEDVAAACVAEILDRVPGPLVVYGHCGPGGALAVEIARRLEAAGRRLEAVYLGGVFPFARPTGGLGRLAKALRMERLRSDTVYANWLQSMGADVGALEPADRRQLIGAMRRDAQVAEDYFTRLIAQGVTPLNAPVVSVVGERDPGTEYYEERFREWDFLTDSTALVVVDEGGHYFLKYRAPELAEIVTGTHHRLTAGDAPDPALDRTLDPALDPASQPAAAGSAATGAAGTTGNWRLVDVHAGARRPAPSGPRPSMARFLTVALSQLVANTGAALTMFAIPLWIYVESESLLRFALFSVVATLPGILAGPVAGALVDRSDRRRVLVAATVAASLVQGSLALLLWAGTLPAGLLYGLLALLSVAVTVQRLAYLSAVPQLVPKRYLGNANGVVQLASGAANFLVPLLAVGLLAAIGLAGILVVEVLGYAVALAVLVVTRFPATMAWRRRETVVEEITGGFWYFWNRRGLRAMLMFFVVINIFLAMVVVLLSPLVLTVGTLADAGRVATIATVGALAGGLLVAVWGGPRRYRMRGMLISTAGYGASALVVALRPDLTVIAAGALGMSFFLVVQNGIWMTIIHTKVPQRFHARVIALNQMAAQSVVAVGFLAAPTLSGVLEPLLRPGGALSGSIGAVVGVGPGRGIALVYVVCGVVMTVVALGALRRTRLATFDLTVPDAEPDDLVGIATLVGRGSTGAGAGPAGYGLAGTGSISASSTRRHPSQEGVARDGCSPAAPG